MIVVSP